jgi:cation/acetate symporter
VSRITTVALGVVAVALGITFEKQNIAFMVSLAFAVAASANFPVLFMSVLWKDCTTRGAVIGGFLGLVSSVALTVVSPAVWEATFGLSEGLGAVPLHLAGAVLDDDRLRRHLAVLDPRSQPAGGEGT